jgi:hypothetical protein
MKSVQPPEFVKNLYRDMRDRRLLLPALLLVVALIAVPVLLTSSSTTSKVPASSGNSSASESAAVPAVVTQELGVTNYRERLDRLQSKNPFHQQYTEPKVTDRVAQASITNANVPTAPSTDTGSTSTDSGSVSSTTSSSGSVTAPSQPTGGTTPSSGGSGGGSSVNVPKPSVRLYTWRASVKIGEPSKLQERPEVQRLAMLPTEGKPVVTFMGASEDGDRALFLVSRDVDSVKGDGHCVPKHSSCQYLVMEPGDKASFHYTPNGKRYNLVLVDVHAVKVDNKLRKKVSGDAQPQAKLPLLGPG